jgi:hypothetical protein
VNQKTEQLISRNDARIAKLAAAQRGKAKEALAKAKADQKKGLRPNNLPPKPAVKKVPALKDFTALSLTQNDINTLAATLGKGSAADKALAAKIIEGKTLSAVDKKTIDQLIKKQLASKNPNTKLLKALSDALTADKTRHFLKDWLKGLASLGGGGSNMIPCDPSGGPDNPGNLTGPGGCDVPPPPGFNPTAPADVCPENAGAPNGPGEVCSIDPQTVSWAPPITQGEGGDEVNTNEEPPVDSVWQVARTLQVSNAAKKKIRVRLQYEAQDDKGNWQEYGADKPLEYTLDPGEIVVMKDGDWDVAARRVRVWAETEDGSQKWVRFKDKELAVVPEKDGGYASPQLQTFALAFR